MTYWTRLDVRPVPHLGTVSARETPRSRYIHHLLAMALVLFVAASLRGATIPNFVVGGHSQGYSFDRITADEVAWFRNELNATEIPSAPRRLYRGSEPNTYPGAVGTVNGHQQIRETPEPGTADLLIGGLIVAMAWRMRL